MRDPYENILIGNFLYSLGLLIGAKIGDQELPGCVNLLQQTPLDSRLADVQLIYPGVVRLIEFKRRTNDSDKEAARLWLLREFIQDDAALVSVSRAIHWFVESSEAPLEWRTDVRPYLDLDTAEQGLSLRPFLSRLVDAALSAQGPEFPPDLLTRYLTEVGTYAGDEGTSSSGLLVTISADGTLHYVALDRIHDFRLVLNELKERAREASREIDQLRTTRDAQTLRVAELERSRGHGYER
ncbi:MAG: hypothetical protein ABL916_00550 [Burkholderiaceae bacterium]